MTTSEDTRLTGATSDAETHGRATPMRTPAADEDIPGEFAVIPNGRATLRLAMEPRRAGATGPLVAVFRDWAAREGGVVRSFVFTLTPQAARALAAALEQGAERASPAPKPARPRAAAEDDRRRGRGVPPLSWRAAVGGR